MAAAPAPSDDPGFSPRLLTALAQARNSEVLGEVIDASLKKAEENRKLTEKAQAERREQERIDQRARESERIEREAAERTRIEQQNRDAEVAARQSARRAQLQAEQLAATTRRGQNGFTGEFARDFDPLNLSA